MKKSEVTSFDILNSAKYILRALYAYETDSEIPKLSDVSPELVYRLASAHKLAGALYRIANDKIGAPENMIPRLENMSATDILKHEAQKNALSDIKALFSKEGIQHLEMKGFVVKSVWKHPECRPMGDLDIFVGDSSALAEQLLLQRGYVKSRDNLEHISMRLSPYILVELHRMLYRGSEMGFSDFNKLSDFEYEMSNENFLVYYIGHAEKHYRHGGCGLRFILDLELYLKRKKEINLASLEDKLSSLGFLDFFHMIRRVTDAMLRDANLPESDTESLLYIAGGGVYGSRENRMKYELKSLGKKEFLRRKLFPPYQTMAASHPVLLKHKYLLPVFYLTRAVASIFNGKAHKTVKNIAKSK